MVVINNFKKYGSILTYSLLFKITKMKNYKEKLVAIKRQMVHIHHRTRNLKVITINALSSYACQYIKLKLRKLNLLIWKCIGALYWRFCYIFLAETFNNSSNIQASRNWIKNSKKESWGKFNRWKFCKWKWFKLSCRFVQFALTLHIRVSYLIDRKSVV